MYSYVVPIESHVWSALHAPVPTSTFTSLVPEFAYLPIATQAQLPKQEFDMIVTDPPVASPAIHLHADPL